jgi:hypothetical protein
MSFWKQSLRKTDLKREILLKLTLWEETLQDKVYWTRARWKRKSPQQIQEMQQFASARLREVLPLAQMGSWDNPEGYVPVVPVEHLPLPFSPDPIPADPQFEASDSQFETTELQPESGELQPEAVDARSEVWEKQPEEEDSQPESVELQPEEVELQPEAADVLFEAVDSPAEASDSHPETVEMQSEASDLEPETGDLPVEAGEREPEDPARLADEMAANFYGFGDWTAPYWFIGLEPGKAPGEEADNGHIVRAWANGLKKGELVDCLEYYRAIGVDAWHKERAKLQPTWRPLMLFLMTALDREADKDALRDYQRTRWGQIGDGETCVIELSGIPAKSLAVETDRRRYLQQRMEAIREKIGSHKPRVVLMYGLAAQSEWERVAGNALRPDEVLDAGSTLFVMTPSPTAYRRKNADWENLGVQVRERLQVQ